MADLSHNPTLGLRLTSMEVPLFRQISQGIRRGIRPELKAGLHLPPERLLARALG